MIKNIILIFLAICFVLLIISYLLNINQLKLWDSSIIEGINSGKLSTELINAIEDTLALSSTNSGVLPTNIIRNTQTFAVDDVGFKAILLDDNKNDITKIEDLKKYVQNILKPKLSADGLILHYTLDDMTGGKVKNIAEETMNNPDYDGTVIGAITDNLDYKYGKGSMRFRYDAGKQWNESRREYIKIPSIPKTFYDDGDNFKGFTFATWFKTTTNSKPWTRLFEFAVGSGGNHSILAAVSYDNDPKYVFFIHGEDTNEFNFIHTKDNIPIDEWVHIATTISTEGVYTNYMNGVEVSSISPNSIPGVQSTKVNDTKDTQATRVPTNYNRTINYIGKSVWYHGNAGFDGRMNDFRIYRKGLSAVEIMNIYNLRHKKIEYKFSNLKVQIDSKKENVIMNKNNTINTFLDKSGKNRPGYPIPAEIEYCPKKEIIGIRSDQRIDIPNESIDVNTIEFTLAIVINVKNYNNGVKYLVRSNVCHVFEWYIQSNTMVCGLLCNSSIIRYNLGGFNADAVNIYILKMDYNNKVSISINGTNCITSQAFGQERIHTGLISVGYHQSSDTVNFYDFMYISGECYDKDKQPYLEGYLAKKWGLLESLPSSHPARINT